MKKQLFAIGLSAGMLLMAGQAFALDYAPGKAPTSSPAQNTAPAAPAAASQMQTYVSQLSQGTMSAQDQRAMYQLMESMGSQITAANGAQNIGYRTMSFAQPTGGFTAPVGYSGTVAWLSLMSIITQILIWAVLLLLIAALWHWLKKHKHN